MIKIGSFLCVVALLIASSTVISLASDDLRSEFKRPAEILFPAENPFSEAKAYLGKVLFFDPRLSGDDTISCATCHNPSFGWEDGLAFGKGMNGNMLGRHSQTIFDLAWGELFFWDGRAETLEEQALGPIDSGEEMNQRVPELLQELNAIEGYKPLLRAAFNTDTFNEEIIGKAIATFERTIVSPRTAFDDWVDGDEAAISASAKRGFQLFTGKANCSECHDGWAFTDSSFHDIGLESEDKGRGQFLKDADFNHSFKTPGLREISIRAPYMHNGSLKTLREVVEHYNDGFIQRPTLSDDMFRLNLSEQEIDDIVSFMKTLDSDPKRELISLPVMPQ
jgi:cytochrome c peroxidase